MSLRFPLVCSIAQSICLVLALVWACVPALPLEAWAIGSPPAALAVGRRSAAMFVGLAWLMGALRSAPPSRLRTAAADAMAIACAALAVLGLAELSTGRAGPGILAAVSVEVVLACALSASVRREVAPGSAVPWASTVPAGSGIEPLVAGARFQDAWSVTADDPALDALGQFVRAARAAPRWVDAAMWLRNRAVVPLGVKDLGLMSAVDPAARDGSLRPGDRLGLFTLRSIRPDEVLLEDRDIHLDVVVSVHRAVPPGADTAIVTVTTVVKTHSLLGRLYMLPVAPMHRIVVGALLRRIGARRTPATR